MGRLLRLTAIVVTGLLLTGCLSSQPKVAQVDQVSATQRAAMEATESPSGGGGGQGGGGPAKFVAIDIAYKDAPTEVKAGSVKMELVDEGNIEHTVAIEELGDKQVLDAQAGETDTATVDLKPGTYTYYCDIPGHRQAGMEGTLTVTE